VNTLYLVATPIGNLEDITLRAIRILRDAPLIAAEDTRTARRLLVHYEIIGKRVTSYTEHNRQAKIPALLDALAAGDVALVSDAGMPGISDPGYDLVVAAIDAGYRVVPIPGASAVTLAIGASGLPSRRFHYLGFLPRTSGARRRALLDAASSGDTLVLFESPHRLRATLEDTLAALGDRRVAVCRELTKLHEEIWRGTLTGAIAHFYAPRGEFTIVLEGGAPASASAAPSDDDIACTIAQLRAEGAPAKKAVSALVERHGLSRRAAYRLWHAG
jgi:16S rRNA (cytidine1402-2'-O)-methyltransferase